MRVSGSPAAGIPEIELSPAQARRTALHAQGFTSRRSPRGPVRAAHLSATAKRLGIVQIDSVNVLARSHYLPFFSRLGAYDPTLLDGLRDGGPRRPRRLVEYWAHEASLIPIERWPLFGFRMRRAHQESWGWMQKIAAERPGLVEAVYAEVAARGPLTSRECEAALAHDEPLRAKEWGWNWSLVKTSLEHLFWAGRLSSAGRTAQFERRYVVPEAVLPPEVLAAGPFGAQPMPPEEAFAALVELAARAHGVGTERCLRDYARLSPVQARPAIERLLREGVLRQVRVSGWRAPAYLHAEAHIPARAPQARALLSPFDSLIWQRERTAALFGFDYRLEFYTPAARRRFGYYVMPFLLGDRLVGRVDVKADRRAGVLRVLAVYWEDGALRRRPDAGPELAAELALLAAFLGLDGVVGYPVRAP